MKSSWKHQKLGEIITLEYGKPLDRTERKQDGLYSVYGANGEKDRSDKFYVDQPSIIVGRKGSAGELNLTEEKFWPLDVTYFVQFDRTQYDLQFLYHLLTLQNLPDLAKGVKPGINRNDVYAIEVKIPLLPEQQRIVAILDEAFEGLAKAKDNAEQNLKNAREVFESHLQAVFSQRGEGWKNVSLGQLCDIIGGGTPSKAVKGYWEGDISWVSPKDMKSEVISDSIDHISEEAIKQSATSLLPKGTVLIVVRSGILARMVPIAVAGCPLTINQDIKGLCPKGTVDTNYLYYFLKSITPKLLAFVSRGATVHRLMTDQIRSLTCPLPPLETQIAIVEKVDAMKAETQRLESIYQRKIAALDELKKSLLHKAFSGEL